MRMRILVSVAMQALLIGCVGEGAQGGSERPPRARPGRLVVERLRSGRQKLLDAPALATYCRGDSVLVIVAIGGSWSAGLALRTGFPPESIRTLTVLPELSGDGSATAAFRAVGDSIQAALELGGGSVTLGGDASATGSFVIALAPQPRPRTAELLVGAFRSLPTADTTAPCGATRAGP